MYKISDEQINFIINDIKKRGVTLESLQDNLLDHICCILEKDPETETNFENSYSKTITTFFKTELKEIEDETIKLVNFKHYYTMKAFLYALLFVSLSYNVFVVAKGTYKHFESKRERFETTIIKEMTLKEGTENLKLLLKKEYPNIVIKDKIYVNFLSNNWSVSDELLETMAASMEISVDSLRQRRKFEKDEKYHQLDSLANVYKNVSFVIAFRRTGTDVDKTIEEYRKKTKNLYFIKDQNKLYSGFKNQRFGKSEFDTQVDIDKKEFVLDKEGALIYYNKLFWHDGIDKNLLVTLSDK